MMVQTIRHQGLAYRYLLLGLSHHIDNTAQASPVKSKRLHGGEPRYPGQQPHIHREGERQRGKTRTDRQRHLLDPR